MPDSVGEWDQYVVFAAQHDWPDFVTAQLDPDFAEELMAYHAAQGERQKAELEKLKKERERAQQHPRRRGRR